jgi:hypothetical protein
MFQLPSHLPTPRPIPVPDRRAAVTILSGPTALPAGEGGYLRLLVRNAGEGTWPPDRLLSVADHWYRDGEPTCWDDGRAALPALALGESAVLSLRITAPSRPGRYEVEIDVVQEAVAWWADHGSPTVRRSIEVLPGATVEGPPAAMEMHGVHRDLVCSLLAHVGCTVLELLPDRAGAPWQSHFYVVEVGAPPA